MEVFEAIAARYSVRGYKADPVDDDILGRVLEAARRAPTAANRQPFRLVVVHTRGRETELTRIYGRPWFVQAPLVVCVVAVPGEAWRRSDDKPYDEVDATIAMDHLVLAATALGLGTCWIARLRPGCRARGAGPARRRRADRLHAPGLPRQAGGRPAAGRSRSSSDTSAGESRGLAVASADRRAPRRSRHDPLEAAAHGQGLRGFQRRGRRPRAHDRPRARPRSSRRAASAPIRSSGRPTWAPSRPTTTPRTGRATSATRSSRSCSPAACCTPTRR